MTKICSICKKREHSANNKPNSLHKTKKKVYPNLQKKDGQLICTQCLRTLDRD